MRITDKIDDYINERGGTDYTTPKKKQGKWDGGTIDDLKKERKRLKEKETRTQKETTRLRQINFALRAKTGWGKVPT